MKYYRNGRVNFNYDKIVKILGPIINVAIYSTVLLGFLILSYKLILGGDKIIAEDRRVSEVVDVFNSNSKIEEGQEKHIPLDIHIENVGVYISKENRIITLPLEEYIKGVVCSEMPLNFNKEALKAQAIAARTYTVSHTKSMSKGCTNGKGADLCDTVHCQVYTKKDEKIKQLGGLGESRWSLVEEVVNETQGMVLTYNNEIVKGAYYFSTSGGKTENVEDVFTNALPYLKSVKSEGEEIAPRYNSTETIDINRFVQIVNENYKDANISSGNLENQIGIDSYTEGGRVKEIRLGDIKITGVKFRELFGLNSAGFSLEFLSNQVIINCIGFGHGVGMSQWGANVMAGEGKTYEEILKHYYTGIEIKTLNNK
ncbi:MAG: stage II sporulation protein D [Clostridium sp.]|uniref:stage II sporulation protein D n=1 Tax=Clostridium sp. TaxID=1506 RepID=UPI003066CC12